MNDDRIERYVSGAFPVERIIKLSAGEIAQSLGKIQSKLNCNGLSINQFMKKIRHESRLLSRVNADDELFDISKLGLNILLDENVILVWDDWIEVDITLFEVFSVDFKNLWFPVADDLDVYDEKGRWILMVDHNGEVRLYENKFR